ncbi:MAG: hypothetical protein R2867_28895 [Caldilineaceae bacterium]
MFASHRTTKLTIMLLLVLLLVVAACGGGDEEESPTSVPAPSATPAAPAAPESPLQPESPISSASLDVVEVSLDDPTVADHPYSMTPPEIPTSQAKMGTLVGRLISSKTNVPLNNELVRMGEVECPEDVPQAEKRARCIWTISNAFSPSTFTDENGFFSFTDVPPREYVVSIGDLMVYEGNLRVADENGPFIWEVGADEVVDIGEHYVEW